VNREIEIGAGETFPFPLVEDYVAASAHHWKPRKYDPHWDGCNELHILGQVSFPGGDSPVTGSTGEEVAKVYLQFRNGKLRIAGAHRALKWRSQESIVFHAITPGYWLTGASVL